MRNRGGGLKEGVKLLFRPHLVPLTLAIDTVVHNVALSNQDRQANIQKEASNLLSPYFVMENEHGLTFRFTWPVI